MNAPQIILNSGHTIPQLGYGTYKIAPGDAADLVATAIEVGYRHIDTAQMYGNEAEVAEGIRRSGVSRDEIFVTTKLDNPNHAPDRARQTFAESLDKMGLDYVDLFLIHWPLPMLYDGDFVTTWHVLEEFVADGRARSIGVSNFEPHHLDKVLAECEIAPAVNQIEIHPYFPNQKAVDYCKDHGIAVESWSPLARADLLDRPEIVTVANNRSLTTAQVILGWHLAKGYITIPKTSTAERMKQNFGAIDALAVLEPDDIAVLDSLDKGAIGRLGPIPDTMGRAWEQER